MTRLCALVLGSIVLVAPAARGEDAIRAKLDAAKAAYKSVEAECQQSATAWFDKRLESARKDGNKQLLDTVKAERKTYDDSGTLPKNAPKFFQKLGPARLALEAAYREAMKDYTKAGKDQEADAAEKEMKAFLSAKATAAKGSIPTITVSMLRAKLNGRAEYNQKTGVLTFNYKFNNKDDLKDFVIGKSKPQLLSGGGILIPPEESIRHVVGFDTLQVTATLGLKRLKGKVLTTTEGVTFSVASSDVPVTGPNVPAGAFVPGGLQLDVKGAESQTIPIPTQALRGTSGRISLAVTEDRVTMHFGSETLSRKAAQRVAGQLELHGGEHGYAFSAMTITGKVNPDWAAAFFAE